MKTKSIVSLKNVVCRAFICMILLSAVATSSLAETRLDPPINLTSQAVTAEYAVASFSHDSDCKDGFIVMIGENTQANDLCNVILIGDGLKADKRYQLKIGSGDKIIIDKTLTKKEWEMMFLSLYRAIRKDH